MRITVRYRCNFTEVSMGVNPGGSGGHDPQIWFGSSINWRMGGPGHAIADC
jgi:hypothetical protein